MGSIPTLVKVFLCPCEDPFPLLGLTLRWDNLGIFQHCNLPLKQLRSSYNHTIPQWFDVYCPEIVGSVIENLVCSFQRILSTSNRRLSCHSTWRLIFPHFEIFTTRKNFKRLCKGIFGNFSLRFCWTQRFFHPAKDLYLSDGVHLTSSGQYFLYRSYLGSILRGLRML